MPRQVQILDYCDMCAQRGEQNPAQELGPISLPDVKRGEPRMLLLCERDRKEFYEPMVAVMLEYGQPLGDAPAPKREQARQRGPRIPRPVVESPCRICKEVFDRDWSASNWESLQSHRANTHQVPNSAYRLWINDLAEISIEDRDALTCKVKLKKMPPGIPDYLKCPAEGCDVAYDPHERDEDSAFRSLANHTSRAHPELPPMRSLIV